MAYPDPKAGPGTAAPSPLGDVDPPGTIRYARGLTSDPVREEVVPRISRSAAVETAGGSGFGEELQPGEPAVALRMVTVGDPEAGARPSLAWVLVWKDSKPDIKGPLKLTRAERARLADQVACIFVMAVDATTGQALEARQICRPK
jgi:hypothetical protein